MSQCRAYRLLVGFRVTPKNGGQLDGDCFDIGGEDSGMHGTPTRKGLKKKRSILHLHVEVNCVTYLGHIDAGDRFNQFTVLFNNLSDPNTTFRVLR